MKNAVVLLAVGLFPLTVSADTRVITLMEDEQFWGGGTVMKPTTVEIDVPLQRLPWYRLK